MASRVSIAGGSDGVGRRSLAVRIERSLSRRALRNGILDPILDVGVTGSLSQQHGTAVLAVAVRVEPHERRHRGFPVGTNRPWAAARRVTDDFCWNGAGCAGQRIDLLPTDGEYGN